VVEHGITGLLVNSSEADKIAQAIEGLIQDPARRLALGLAAQKRAYNHFSAQIIVPSYEALYERITKLA
jgi:glycosyltransferase involved in cell wall biosynthesis